MKLFKVKQQKHGALWMVGVRLFCLFSGSVGRSGFPWWLRSRTVWLNYASFPQAHSDRIFRHTFASSGMSSHSSHLPPCLSYFDQPNYVLQNAGFGAQWTPSKNLTDHFRSHKGHLHFCSPTVWTWIAKSQMTPMSAQIACTGDEICNSVSLAVAAWMITTLKTSTTSIEQSRTKNKTVP